MAAIFLSSMLLKLTTTLVAFLIWVPAASAWSWPVSRPVLQPFSYDEAHPYDAGQHRGIDIGASVSGDPVVAPASGTVNFAGFVPTSGESLTIETADGYSVTLTHLGSIGVARGAAVSEGDVVATVGPSGTPEQSVPYVHLGIRKTADPLGYLDPLGFLPAPATPTPTPVPQPQQVAVPVPVPVPAPKAAPAPGHAGGGGLVIEKPSAAPSSVAAPAVPPGVTAPAAPAHVAKPHPKTRPKPSPAPAAQTFRVDAPQIRRPLVEPIADGVPVPVKPLVHAIEAEPLVMSIAPGIVAALLALVTAFARSRRDCLVPARVIAFRKELPLQSAA
jgi:hypothetical protein